MHRIQLVAALLLLPAESAGAQSLDGLWQSQGYRTAHVTRIGENTQGVFCDVLDRRLPNGWIFALPNAVYRTAEGTAFDVQGIPPDIRAPVFADDDVAANKDPAMALAVQMLRGKK